MDLSRPYLCGISTISHWPLPGSSSFSAVPFHTFRSEHKAICSDLGWKTLNFYLPLHRVTVSLWVKAKPEHGGKIWNVTGWEIRAEMRILEDFLLKQGLSTHAKCIYLISLVCSVLGTQAQLQGWASLSAICQDEMPELCSFPCPSTEVNK